MDNESQGKNHRSLCPKAGDMVKLLDNQSKVHVVNASPPPKEKEISPGSKAKQQVIVSYFMPGSSKRKEPSRDEQEQKDHVEKKRKSEEGSSQDSEEKEEKPPVLDKPLCKIPLKCLDCKQLLDSDTLKLFTGDAPDAVEEFVMLCDPKLSLFDEGETNGCEDRPQHKITQFSVYDRSTHLCPFDLGMIEKNKELYFSGYVKPIYDENSGIDGGVATKKLGPINEWWIAGFDGGENALIGFSTGFAEYILMQPSEEYTPFFSAVKEKIYMSKIVIEFIVNNPDSRYEDLLHKLETTVPPENCSKFTEDSLLRHAQFLVEQVESYDSTADDDELLLVATPCMRDLIKLAGVTLGKRRALRGVRVSSGTKAKTGQTMATTTPLVKHVFDIFFKDQIDPKNSLGSRRKKCGVCEACQQPDCGKCTCCRAMKKFGGTGKAKQACALRRCPYMEIKDADDNEQADEETEPIEQDSKTVKHCRKGQESVLKTKLKWEGESYLEKKQRQYYKQVYVQGELISVGDFVKVCPDDPSDPLYICQVAYMWERADGKKLFHSSWLLRSADTVLGETGDPAQLFWCDECDDNPLGSIMGKCKVELKTISDNWAMEGGLDNSMEDEQFCGEKDTFYVEKWNDRDEGRFVDIPPVFLKEKDDTLFCPSCQRLREKKQYDLVIPKDEIVENEIENSKKTFYKSFAFKGETYSISDCVYLPSDCFSFKVTAKSGSQAAVRKTKVDEETYPEFYRKSSDYIKGCNAGLSEPYRIGEIVSIYQKNGAFNEEGKVMMRVRKFYRPENTHKGPQGAQSSDFNILYWSKEEATVNVTDIERKCYVMCGDELQQSVRDYTVSGPDRFYFYESYNSETMEFEDPPTTSLSSSSKGKGKGKGKGKSSVSSINSPTTSTFHSFPEFPKIQKLRSLDVFSGCGGLSEGLHECGVTETKWAIEFEEPAAQAFRLNNPDAVVFNEDCNKLLKLVMQGDVKDAHGQILPQKGEVEMLCGGPPCQGFSGMNRFNSREYSQFKNSLVSSYLSYCDYYRPRFFILENVRNFVSFKKSMVLKLALRCLLKMGYQCAFGILQAGHYGVSQTRRRAIIIAAAPGESLPNYPEPLHVFNMRSGGLSVTIDDRRFQAVNNISSAPYRTVTVRDVMSDLPQIRNGENRLEISYDSEPLTHFQKKMRDKLIDAPLRDHVCKEMNPLVAARMRHIPLAPGSDWRDLPNIIVRLSDGNYSSKLVYTHKDKRNGNSSNGSLRGVCTCSEEGQGKCESADRQFNTLVPWCLPHTGNRHNHWAGLYGRLEWDGFFSTTITNPEPMGKQGRVLHPEQHRVVSVRECARSQGFPDHYRFFGSILDKHRQVGNAVPPPLAAAIGREISKSVGSKSSKTENMSKDLEN